MVLDTTCENGNTTLQTASNLTEDFENLNLTDCEGGLYNEVTIDISCSCWFLWLCLGCGADWGHSGETPQTQNYEYKRCIDIREIHDERDGDKHENLPSTSDEVLCSMAGSVDKVCMMLQTFMREQHLKDELWRHKAEKQEQRWRSMQRQFNLLQEQVRGTQHQDRPTRGMEDEFSKEETERLC
ncbi:hypothetical protein MHYP_G00031780 [Metynnis hypsauchen]